nr:hypothetical protein [Saccharopolyspora pogona]
MAYKDGYEVARHEALGAAFLAVA